MKTPICSLPRASSSLLDHYHIQNKPADVLLQWNLWLIKLLLLMDLRSPLRAPLSLISRRSLSEDGIIVITSFFITFRLKMPLMRQLVVLKRNNDLSGLQYSARAVYLLSIWGFYSGLTSAAVILILYRLSALQRLCKLFRNK